jgi:formate-dependent nitrite reductase membrane component NrfD
MYTTFQLQSPMSWGAWILLLTLLLLALRFVGQVPAPRQVRLLGLNLFAASEDEEGEKPAAKPTALAAAAQWLWPQLYRLACWTQRFDRALALAGVVLGVAVGFYTGVLLSTIPSRPLWNSAVLAPLFLVSALASGGAFLALFLPHREQERLTPVSILACGVEILLLLAFALSLSYGSQAAQRSGAILFNGVYGWVFWGLVLVVGLVAPAVLESLEVSGRALAFSPRRLPPALKLLGGLALRFVIVYAGILSFL